MSERWLSSETLGQTHYRSHYQCFARIISALHAIVSYRQDTQRFRADGARRPRHVPGREGLARFFWNYGSTRRLSGIAVRRR